MTLGGIRELSLEVDYGCETIWNVVDARVPHGRCGGCPGGRRLPTSRTFALWRQRLDRDHVRVWLWDLSLIHISEPTRPY